MNLISVHRHEDARRLTDLILRTIYLLGDVRQRIETDRGKTNQQIKLIAFTREKRFKKFEKSHH